MKDYSRTLWENNKTVVDADNLNNIEDQLLIITGSLGEEVEKIKIIEDTLPMKANINHTHDDLATIEDFNSMKIEIDTAIDDTITELLSCIDELRTEIKNELKKYYNNVDIQGNTLYFYTDSSVTAIQLPVAQAPAIKSICGDFLCGEQTCNDYSTSILSENLITYDMTLWENGITPVNADNLNKIERNIFLLTEKVKELSETGIDLADSFIHTGSTTPSTTKGIWIDNSDEEETILSNTIVEQFAAALKKQQEQIAELYYITDAYLDDGLFEDDETIAEEFDGGEF